MRIVFGSIKLISAIEKFFFFSYFFSKRKRTICGTDTSKSDAELVSTTRNNAKGDNPDGKPNSHSWVRIRRIGNVAFCFVLLTVFFAPIIYLLGPYCCEAGNTLNRFTLQVRYPRGPPPVWVGEYDRYTKNIDVKNQLIFDENDVYIRFATRRESSFNDRIRGMRLSADF